MGTLTLQEKLYHTLHPSAHISIPVDSSHPLCEQSPSHVSRACGTQVPVHIQCLPDLTFLLFPSNSFDCVSVTDLAQTPDSRHGDQGPPWSTSHGTKSSHRTSRGGTWSSKTTRFNWGKEDLRMYAAGNRNPLPAWQTPSRSKRTPRTVQHCHRFSGVHLDSMILRRTEGDGGVPCVRGRNQGFETTGSAQRRVSGDGSATTGSIKKTPELVLGSACQPCLVSGWPVCRLVLGLCCLSFRPLPCCVAESAACTWDSAT